jgi:hypothetical protein
VEATGQLRAEAHQLYRLIKRLELLVSDLQPYALRSKSTLEAVFAVLQVCCASVCWGGGGGGGGSAAAVPVTGNGGCLPG